MHLSQNAISQGTDLNENWNKLWCLITVALTLDNSVSDFQNVQPREDIHCHFHHQVVPTVLFWQGTKVVKLLIKCLLFQ